MDDLERLAENLPAADFQLLSAKATEGEASESKLLISRLRGDLTQSADDGSYAGPNIIFCSHAMLAVSQKGRWTGLPAPKVLIIDEAHLLEETLSRINSDEVSVFSLRSRLSLYANKASAKKGSVYREAVFYAESIEKTCLKLDTNDNQISANLADFPKERAQLAVATKTLADLLDTVPFKDFERRKSDIQTLSGIANGLLATGYRSDVRFSPCRRYPLIISGTADIGRIVGELWKVADGGAILASATLYTVDDYGQDDCKYVVKNLSIPLHRIETPAPIVSPAVFGIPTLYTPTDDLAQQLRRPLAKVLTPENESEWLGNLSMEIAEEVASTAKGGTLVLLTSYKQIEKIATHMADYGVDPSRIVRMNREQRFVLAKQEFINRYREGKRPIFLALGPAWTGLDLADKTADAHNDFLLSDLVIGCSPIGLNQSPTMMRRKEYANMLPVIKEALMVFKQGIGRLIRRNGVTDRRLWIMDGRIFSDWKAMAGFTNGTKRLLQRYNNQEKFG